MRMFDKFRRFYAAKSIQRVEPAASSLLPSVRPGAGHRPKTKEDLRQALEEFKALRHGKRGIGGNVLLRRVA